MARERRSLYGSITTSIKVGMLKTAEAKLLYTWMIPHCDDEGRIQGDPLFIKAKIFPMFEKVSTEDAIKYLQDLWINHLIEWYIGETKGKESGIFIQIVDWDEHQSFKAITKIPSKIPPPPPPGQQRMMIPYMIHADGYRGANWKDCKKKALERSGYQCELCENDRFIVVHHVIQYRYEEHNSQENLIVLCRSCHGYIERFHTIFSKFNREELILKFGLIDKPNMVDNETQDGLYANPNGLINPIGLSGKPYHTSKLREVKLRKEKIRINTQEGIGVERGTNPKQNTLLPQLVDPGIGKDNGKIDAKGLADLYLSLCPNLSGLQEIRSRAPTIRVRLKEHPDPAFWENVFKKANFIEIGPTGIRPGWKPDFDWLIKNKLNAVRVVEGKYDNLIMQKMSGGHGGLMELAKERGLLDEHGPEEDPGPEEGG